MLACMRDHMATMPLMQHGVPCWRLPSLSVVQPSLTALETIGRPRGERWDFVDICWRC